ncbi:hypothetical protein CAEBREN_17406 [Caenorhabditis brenneri]|uniref:BTB domain-containing protein n=1 Tax=Caenorhabditis brenneri TaxID=135651 RepID=G0MD85_CAEBE|nr:hypothetical protein CAEBREN_17406 [Caenorhabditis brenneri]
MKEFVLTHVVKNVSSMKEKESHFSDVEEHFGVGWSIAVMKEFVLTHVVENVSSLKENEPHFSDVEEHFGVGWKLKFYRRSDYRLSFYLFCEIPCNNGNWSISTNFKLKLLSATGKTLVKPATVVFGNSSKEKVDSWGFMSCLEWSILEKDYVVDDTVTLEAHVKIEKMIGIEKKLRDFSESAEEISDVVLIVDNQKFYVSKLFLAGQSSYFKALLCGKFQESEKSEITLTDINPIDFQNFLEILHGEPAINGNDKIEFRKKNQSVFTENTFDGILQLADMYDAKTVIRQCEKYLMQESDRTLKEKLKISAKYNLKYLRDKCLLKIETVEDIRSVVSGDLTKMNPLVLAALLQKCLSLH